MKEGTIVDATTFNYVLAQFGVAGVILVVVLLALYKLGSDLAKLRTDLQQQVARDLLNKRFVAYGELWAKLQPLAIYSDDPLTSSRIRQLGEALSQWYFSAEGGMFLTSRAREFYFALQDILEAAGELKGWKCTHRPDDVQKIFRVFLSSAVAFPAESLDEPQRIDPKLWRQACKTLAERLKALTAGPEMNNTVFAAVQQVSSALRSILAFELHTRLDSRIPQL